MQFMLRQKQLPNLFRRCSRKYAREDFFSFSVKMVIHKVHIASSSYEIYAGTSSCMTLNVFLLLPISWPNAIKMSWRDFYRACKNLISDENSLTGKYQRLLCAHMKFGTLWVSVGGRKWVVRDSYREIKVNIIHRTISLPFLVAVSNFCFVHTSIHHTKYFFLFNKLFIADNYRLHSFARDLNSFIEKQRLSLLYLPLSLSRRSRQEKMIP